MTGKRTTATAPNRGKRCRCGNMPDRKAALEHREDGGDRETYYHTGTESQKTLPVWDGYYKLVTIRIVCSTSDVLVSEAAIRHPDMRSAYNRLQRDSLFFRSERVPFFFKYQYNSKLQTTMRFRLCCFRAISAPWHYPCPDSAFSPHPFQTPVVRFVPIRSRLLR